MKLYFQLIFKKSFCIFVHHQFKVRVKKNLNKEEKENRKSNIKSAIVFILIVGTIAPLVWYAQEYFAEESWIEYHTTAINGDTLSVILTEKTSSPNRNRGTANDHHDSETRDRHYGYLLELYDSAANTSLNKIEFESPVWNIQETLELLFYQMELFGSFPQAKI